MAAFGMFNAGRILIAVVLLWLLLIFFIGGPLLKRTDNDYNLLSGENAEIILARLTKATNELNSLKQQNEELRNLLQTYIPLELKIKKAKTAIEEKQALVPSPDDEAILRHEDARRRVAFGVNELYNYLRATVNASVLQLAKEHRYNLLYDIKTLEEKDYPWRKQELRKLTDLVNSKLKELQNPDNCKVAQKVVCQLNKACGFGCQLHHVAYCFITAVAMKRTLILDASSWHYAPGVRGRGAKGSAWSRVFLPVSESCLDDSGQSRSSWRDHTDSVQVIDLPLVDTINPRPPFLPLSIPKQLSSKLQTLHGLPIAWFVGQLLRYIMRPSVEMQEYINAAKKRLGFEGPIVGVHVRRTDKVGTEAAFHSLSEYMGHVEDFFNKTDFDNARSNKPVKATRRIYLATDDSTLWRTEVRRYEEMGYTFIGDSNIAKSAGPGKRYSMDSLRNIILDIWLLSECDHLVCTFSSQVCRLAFELMQTRGLESEGMTRIDWSTAYTSLDDIYYFGGQGPHNQKAIINHKARRPEEIDMKIGDTIGIAGNHWNGFSKGLNRKTRDDGLYPGFKTVEQIDEADFKTFEDVKW